MDKIKLFNGLPLFEAKVNNGDDTGVYCVSFVDNPATEVSWVAFEEDKQYQKYSIVDNEEHIVSGIIMVASKPILRLDSNGGGFYVVYSKETLKQMAEKMLKEGFTSSVNIQHNNDKYVDGVNLVEIYIIDKEKGVCPTYFSEVPDGSLVGTYKIHNDAVWEMVKNGDILSFSLEGVFDIKPVFENNNKKTYNTMNLIEKFMKKLMKFEEISTDKGVLLTVEGEELAIGVEVYVPVEGGWEPAADGEYKTDDETIIVVDGKVSEIKEYEMDEPAIDKPVEVQAEETVVVEEPAVDERDDKQEQIDSLKSEINELKAEIEGLKKVIADIVQKPVTEPIVEEFSMATEHENKHNKAAKLLSHLNN